MNVLKFSSLAFFAIVPIISSASYPLFTKMDMFKAFKISSMIGTAIFIPSGVSSLFAL